jgi:tRNA-splicing ligase RtcB
MRTQNLAKRMIQLSAGEIDRDAARHELVAAGVELRASGADEAPYAYKRLDAVLGYHAASIRIVQRLTPIGVAMAGAQTFDPYKD